MERFSDAVMAMTTNKSLMEAVKNSQNSMPNDRDMGIKRYIVKVPISCHPELVERDYGDLIKYDDLEEHDSIIRDDERKAAAERARHQTCKDCYNVADCGYAYNQEYECEKAQRIVDAILNEE